MQCVSRQIYDFTKCVSGDTWFTFDFDIRRVLALVQSSGNGEVRMRLLEVVGPPSHQDFLVTQLTFHMVIVYLLEHLTEQFVTLVLEA